MKRTSDLARLAVIGLGCLGAPATAPAASAVDAPASPPNIVLVITDDQGYGQVGRHGHPWLQTPNLDRLYDQSTRFTRFLVSPTCAPTRAALMTGRHPMRNGVTHTIWERERLTLDAVTLPQVLKSVGYRTGIFGKWHLGDEELYQPHRRGFDEAFIHGAGGIGQAYECSCADAPGNTYFDPAICHNGAFVRTRGYCTDVFFQAALGWIKSTSERGQPLFAYVATNAPHKPFVAPPEDTTHFEALGMSAGQAGFYGMIRNLDENLGRMLNRLDAWGLADDTLFIFMSDNGTVEDGAGEEGSPVGTDNAGRPLLAYNAGMRGYKVSVDEGGVRVPFFVRWPGVAQPGRDIDTVAAHVDLAPTLIEAAGARFPTGQVEGRSLLPQIRGDAARPPDRYLFSHRGRWPVGADPNAHRWKHFAVRNNRFRMVGRDALYDMQADPGQRRNVLADHPAVAEAMLAAYERWWEETVPMMVNEDAPLAPERPFHELYQKQSEDGGIPEWRPSPL